MDILSLSFQGWNIHAEEMIRFGPNRVYMRWVLIASMEIGNNYQFDLDWDLFNSSQNPFCALLYHLSSLPVKIYKFSIILFISNF